jgi:pilus assembly protein CpaF
MIQAGNVTAEELEYMICETMDLFVFVKKVKGSARKVVRVVQLEGWDKGAVSRDIFIGHDCVGHINESLRNRIQDNLDGDLPKIPAFAEEGC